MAFDTSRTDVLWFYLKYPIVVWTRLTKNVKRCRVSCLWLPLSLLPGGWWAGGAVPPSAVVEVTLWCSASPPSAPCRPTTVLPSASDLSFWQMKHTHTTGNLFCGGLSPQRGEKEDMECESQSATLAGLADTPAGLLFHTTTMLNTSFFSCHLEKIISSAHDSLNLED